MNRQIRDAKKRVHHQYPFAVAFQADPFYGWAILVSKGSNTVIVQKKRSEEEAWLDAASVVGCQVHFPLLTIDRSAKNG